MSQYPFVSFRKLIQLTFYRSNFYNHHVLLNWNAYYVSEEDFVREFRFDCKSY